MTTSITEARRAVRAALTAVTHTLTLPERETWMRELELLRQVEASLTERLHQRSMRVASVAERT